MPDLELWQPDVDPPKRERHRARGNVGWTFSVPSSKAHYFDDRLIDVIGHRSWCGRWAQNGKFHAEKPEAGELCRACLARVKLYIAANKLWQGTWVG